MPYKLEFFNDATRCLVVECRVDEGDIMALIGQLEMARIEVGAFYDLLPQQAIVFSGYLELESLADISDFKGVTLDCWCVQKSCGLDGLSYLIHTNRELLMMLQRDKPLAVFIDTYPEASGSIPEEAFAPYVRKGRFIRKESIEESILDGKPVMFRRVMYAQPSEEWRFEAYLENTRQADGPRFNPDIERREGELLGYTDKQNDEYLSLLIQDNSESHLNESKLAELPIVFERDVGE